MMRSGGRVAMSASIRREEMALTFWTAGDVSGSNMMPTPADSCFRESVLPFLPFPLPSPMYGMVVCSFSFDEK